MEIAMLGPLKLSDHGNELHLAGFKPQILVAMLASNANEPVSVNRLTEALWETIPPRTATGSLRVYIYQLRNILTDKDRVFWRAPGYGLKVEDGELDIDRFESLAARGREAFSNGQAEIASKLMNHALELWRGPALSGFEDVMTLHPTAIRLEERRLSVIEWRIEADLACGSGPDLVADLAELVAKYPLRERFRAQLMLALGRSGRQAEALAAYRTAWQLLNRELGIEPGAELQRIHQAILNG